MTSSGDLYGQLRFHIANAIIRYAEIPSASLAVINEFGDNAKDAQARTIWIVLDIVDGEPVLRIIDNGHGMTDQISTSDWDTIRVFFEDIAEGRFHPETDIRAFISEGSLKSLEWMTLMVAFSGKVPQKGKGLRGVKGIGFQSFRQLAERAVVLTKPSTQLAAIAWREGDPRIANPPTFLYIPPTLEMLQRFDTSVTLEQTSQVLTDPYGKPLPHGMMLELRGVKTDSILRPAALVDSLKGHFGAVIREGELRILVVDRLTEEGRRHLGGGGLETVVPAIQYRGTQLVSGQDTIRGGLPFSFELYFDPRGRRFEPTFRRLGADLGPISKLPRIKGHPILATGKLNGYVELPEQILMNSEKIMPLESNILKWWTDRVVRLLDECQSLVQDIERRARDNQVRELTATVSSVAQEALEQFPQFEGLNVGPPVRERPVRPRRNRKSPRRVDERTVATVFDEYNRPVSNIQLELLQDNQVLSTPETGASGKVSFGVLEAGRYLVRILLPRGTDLGEGASQYPFTISKTQPAFHAVFRVVTGARPPEGKRLNRIIAYPVVLDDPNQPYSAARFAVAGVLEINSESEPWRSAQEQNDKVLLETLTAQYLASAITEIAMESGMDPGYVLLQASMLFNKIMELMLERRP